jgi:hypothetical protein
MSSLGSFLPPALALLIIVRRGSKPRRVKATRLWRFPILISLLALVTLGGSGVPGVLPLAMYIVGLGAGAAVGWFSAQHVELTLDSKTGTIMSKPTVFGTMMTAGAFVARFAVDYVMKGGLDGDASTPALRCITRRPSSALPMRCSSSSPRAAWPGHGTCGSERAL